MPAYAHAQSREMLNMITKAQLGDYLLLALTILTITAHAQEGMPLRLVQAIPLPHVEGRIDHLAADLYGQRLFVAALGNNTLEVLDLTAGTHLHTITGLHEPQGVVFLPESNTIVVTNGQTDCEECQRDWALPSYMKDHGFGPGI